MYTLKNLSLLFLLSIFFSCGTSSKTFLFVGSYTNGIPASGIYVYQLNPSTGELQEVEREGNLINPSFLTISPNGKYLYSCTESQLKTHGSVSAFQIDSLTGKINFINKQSSGGRNPAHVVVDHSNRYIFCSNFTDSGIGTMKCNSDGSLEPLAQYFEYEEGSIVPKRQDVSHLHSGNISPDGKFLFAPDLGSDKIRVFNFDPNNLLTENHSLTLESEKGAGPRHFTFHPQLKTAYAINEINGTVSSYELQNGQLKLIDQDFSYQNPQDKYSSADIHISPDGKYLYASNRGNENTLSIFSVDLSDGKLTIVGHQSTFGETPRSFVIDPSGNFLIVANQNSNKIIVFKRDKKTGLLSKTDSEVVVNSPSSLKVKRY